MTGQREQVEHITDFERDDGGWALCGERLPRYTTGSGVMCEACSQIFKQRKGLKGRRGDRSP